MAAYIRNIFVTLVLLNVSACSLGQNRHDAEQALPKRVSVPADGVALPMLDYRGLPIVEVSINGKGPFRFILDTGANATVIGEELQRELALPAPAGVHAGDSRVSSLVSIHDFRVGAAALEDVLTAVMPLGPVLGANAQGVLSAASFPGYLVIFDYPAQRLSIRSGSLDRPDSQSVFGYEDPEGIPSVPVHLAGHETRVHLDTGSVDALSVPMAFLKILPLASEPREAKRVRLVGREFPVMSARVSGAIEIGKFPLELDEVRFSDAHGGSTAAIGTLGYGVLRNFVLTLDSKNRRIRLER